MIGAFIIGILRNGLNMSGVSAFIQQIVIASWSSARSGSIRSATALGPHHHHRRRNQDDIAEDMPGRIRPCPDRRRRPGRRDRVIVKTTNSNFWQNVNLGAQAAIEGQSEHTLSFDGPAAESAVADQVSLVENAINRGVAGLVLAPSDPER